MLLKRVRTIAAAVESTVGTAESLSASDGVFNAYNPEIQAEIDSEEREAQGSMDTLSHVPSGRAGTMTFATDMGWDGSAVPEWASILLPACGYVESSQVYTPRSEAPGSNVKTLTLGMYENGLFKSLVGAVGTFKIVCPAGKIPMIEWEFKGVWQAPSDVAIIAPTYPTNTPLRFGAGTITYNSVAQVVENVTFDAGNEITMREDASKAAGFISGLITDRRPMVTLNPESQLVATQDKFGLWVAGTEAAFSCAIDGPTGTSSNGNVTLAASKAQVKNITESDRGKIQVDEVELACNKNGATKDQQITITFTDKVDA